MDEHDHSGLFPVAQGELVTDFGAKIGIRCAGVLQRMRGSQNLYTRYHPLYVWQKFGEVQFPTPEFCRAFARRTSYTLRFLRRILV